MALQIEVAHEALIQNWRRLGDWLNQDREYLLWRQALRAGVDLWRENKEDHDTLLRGTLLQIASDWESKRSNDLGPDEKAYIAESRKFEILLQREKLRRQRLNFTWWGAVGLLVIASFSIWWISSQSTEKTLNAGGYLGQASLYEQRGDFNSAIDAYNKALKLSPEFAFAYLGRAKVYYRLGGDENYRKAIDDYSGFIEFVRDVSPHDLALAYDGRGQAYLQVNDFDNARKDFTTALEKDHQSAQALYDLGRLFVRQGNPGEAINWYTQAIANAPDFYDAYLARGKAFFTRYKTAKREDDLTSALNDFNQAQFLKNDAAEPYLNIGLVYNERGDTKKAIDLYEQALTHNNNSYAEAYNALGEAYLQMRQLEKAIANFNLAAKSGDTRAYYNLGLAYKDKGDFENAIDSLQAFIAKSPGNGEAFLPLGEAYALKGDHKAAIQNYSKSLELKPEQTDAYFNRGESYVKTGDKDKAVNDFLAFLKSSTTQKTPATQERLYQARQHLEQLDFQPPIDFVQIHLHYNKSIDEAFLETVKNALKEKRFNRIISSSGESDLADIRFFQYPFKPYAQNIRDIVKGVYDLNKTPQNFPYNKFPDPKNKDAYGWIEVWLPASHPAAPAPSPKP